MNNRQLSAIRRKLAFTEEQAATLIAPAAGLMISAAQWKSMEEGAFPLSDALGAVMQHLVMWQEKLLAESTKQIEALTRQHGAPRRIALIEYQSLDDWVSLPDRDPILWRPHCSAVKALSKDRRVRIVPFNGPAYNEWLKGRIDGEDLRAAWAAEQ